MVKPPRMLLCGTTLYLMLMDKPQNSTQDAPQATQLIPRVKVCGITLDEDAAALDSLSGIAMLGFNFWPKSKRFIDLHRAGKIIAKLRNSLAVGVFVDPTLDEIRAAHEIAGIHAIQLHGHESSDFIALMPLPVIKAVAQDEISTLQGLRSHPELFSHPSFSASTLEPAHRNLPQHPHSPASSHSSSSPASQNRPIAALLFDTRSGNDFGGTGHAFDWSVIREQNHPVPFFLAGGIGPRNLHDAVTQVRPYAVDLNSKVEKSPGIKDIAAVNECLKILNSMFKQSSF